MYKKNTDSLVSVYELKIDFKVVIQNEGGYIKGISKNKYYSENRQTLPKAFMPNGAIYIINVNVFLDNKCFVTKKTVPFLF